SMHATSSSGECAFTSVAVMSSSPRTAFTGMPSGAVIDSGTPKKARKYSDGVSRSISPAMWPILASRTDNRAPLAPEADSAEAERQPYGEQAGVVGGVGAADRGDHAVQVGREVVAGDRGGGEAGEREPVVDVPPRPLHHAV